ncbi:response regulator [Halorarum halophilum]|uniref:Response regulator n=1 Tax=Halorarum halophilum TaxID=2743090 RepID=A0A7D5KCC4_9EURY|nr:response regulator [Halobaculum halophilum]QLG26517.1 response regulator [Halobaculum halophilum]
MSERLAGDPAEILLVEDNPGDIRLTQEAFEEGEIRNTLRVVTDGVAAMDFLYQRGDHADAPRPDLVLLDLNLPQKSGHEVLSEIKDDPELMRIPVIILTGSEVAEDIVRSYDHTANAYLTKPVDPDEFIDVVRTFKQFWLSIVSLPNHED